MSFCHVSYWVPLAFFQTLLNSNSVGVLVIVAVSVSPAAIVWLASPPVTATAPSCFQPDGIVLVGSLTVYLIPSGMSVITAVPVPVTVTVIFPS